MFGAVSINNVQPQRQCPVCGLGVARSYCSISHRDFYRGLLRSAYDFEFSEDEADIVKEAKRLHQLGYVFVRNRFKRIDMKHYHTWKFQEYYVIQWRDE